MSNIRKPYYEIESSFKYFEMLYGSEDKKQEIRYSKIFERFKKEFNAEKGYIASSGGRVEVCGNHTDHNGGRVISCTISLDTLAVFLPSE